MKDSKQWTPSEMGKKGGKARAKNLTKEEISAISRKAGLASAEKRKQQKQEEESKTTLENDLRAHIRRLNQ